MVVLIGSSLLLFSENAFAKDQSFKLIADEAIQVGRTANFSIETTTPTDNLLTINYPESFRLDEEKFATDNQNTLEAIKHDLEKHQLSFKVNNKKNQAILFSGEFQEIGTQKLTVASGEEKEQFSLEVQAAEVSPPLLDDALSTDDNAKADTLPSFDWNLLNDDGLDLSTFKQVSENTPVKLTGGAFDKSARNYYMFFGHVGKDNTYNYSSQIFNKTGNMYATLGRTSLLPLLSPGMIGVKKNTGTASSTKIFGYDYDYESSGVGNTGANFDIGEMNSTSGSILKSGYRSVYDGENKPTSTWIISQYVKENEIVAYGFLKKDVTSGDSNISYQAIRVHGYVVSKSSGRIRYDVSYYNNNSTSKYYALNFGAHMDVGGAHTDSKLFSYGDSGIYFDEPRATPVDGIPARIYFYMNKGYGENLGPNAYKTGNLASGTSSTNRGALYKIAYWKNLTVESWTNKIVGYTKPYEAWDPFQVSGYQFPLSHPIFAYRWEPVQLSPGEVGTGSLDLSIEEPAPIMPTAEKTYKNENASSKENYVGDTLSFSVVARNKGDMDTWRQVALIDTLPKELELDVNSLTLVDVNGDESKLDPSVYDQEAHRFTAGLYDIPAKKQVEIKYKAKIVSGGNQKIINKFDASNSSSQLASDEVEIPITENLDFKLKEEVFDKDGKVADKATQGDTLHYKVTVLNPKSSSELFYKSFQGPISVDSHLENLRNISIKDQGGKVIGNGIIASDKLSIVYAGGTSESDSINQDLFIEFDATVNQDTPDGTIVKSKASFWAEFVGGSKLRDFIESNEVQTEISKKRGDLVFVSAPNVLDFGKSLKISAKDQAYPIAEKDDNLVVQDGRGVGEHWSMTAMLLDELTSDSGHQLVDSLHYKDQKQDHVFIKGESIPIIEKETIDEQAVDISKEWQGTKIGPYLDVKAGKPRAEKYSGAIQWTLQDVPTNNGE
ncbi:hypothetical protein [Enterococcus sp. 5H]|uniref:hypothetical protein n=1 Tax=Enterococcus sp. 5H TaxID=1229490 RepID=UPI002304C9EC|nr:hypothetical protein [Enterococcus sp. 5H]